MTKGLSPAQRPRAYTGVQASQPPNFTTNKNAPTPNNYAAYEIGDFWFHYVGKDDDPLRIRNLYTLISKNYHGKDDPFATWVLVTSAHGSVVSLTSNDNIVVPPLLGNINVVGDNVTIRGVGNAATHTITFSVTDIIASRFTTNFGFAVPAFGNLNILGAPAIRTEAAGDTVTIDLARTLDGRIPIGSSSGPTLFRTLTAGANITIANGPNMITISSTGGGGGDSINFIGKLETTSDPITGDGTFVSLGDETGPLTVIVNNGSAFTPGNGAGIPATFTAPIPGVYLLEVSANFIGGSQPPSGAVFRIVTTAQTYTEDLSAATPNSAYMQVIANMDSGDTATFELSANNSNPDDVSIGDADTYAAGALLASSASTPLLVHTNDGDAMETDGEINIFGDEMISTDGDGVDTVTINLDRGNDGQIPIAATGAPTAYANITSLDNSVTILNGPNSIDLSSNGGYLTGTWTPDLSFGGSTTGITYAGGSAARGGTWTRIGNVVYFTGYYKLTSKGSATGLARVAGLPYTQSVPAFGTVINCNLRSMTTNSLANCSQLDCTVITDDPTAPLMNYQFFDGSGFLSELSNTDFTNNSESTITGFYYTDAPF